ncbi:MAG TPA: hypothetical protein PKE06_26670, partial [Flavilitoribacter sp.]|nr:hypothetical protein [Flavilitoribacter sp.]
WSTLLTSPVLTDGTDVTTFNFTKGNDGWDPLPELIANDIVRVNNPLPESAVRIHAFGDRIYVSNVSSRTVVRIYSVNGVLLKAIETDADTDFNFTAGLWVVVADAADGRKAVKVVTH